MSVPTVRKRFYPVGQRRGCAVMLGAALTLLAAPGFDAAAGHPVLDIAAGEVGFVVHEWGTAGTFGAPPCPEGRSLGYRQIFEQGPEGQRRQDEPEGQYVERLEAGGLALATLDGGNLCANPELAPDDPHFRSMNDTGICS